MLSQIRKCVQYLDDPWSIAPSVVEISPSGRCNHKCGHCMYADSHDGAMLPLDVVTDLAYNLSDMKVPAIMWTGGGEPLKSEVFESGLLHMIKNMGIKQGLNTNGYYLRGRMAHQVLATHDWIRISLDAVTRKTYKKIHGVDHWVEVIQNITNLVKMRDEIGSKCVIGLGAVASTHNWCELSRSRIQLLMRNLGFDHFQIKPSVRAEDWENEGEFTDAIAKALEIDKCDDISSTKYKWDAIGQLRSYGYCGATYFLSYVDANGDVYPCSSLQNDPEYSFGNIEFDSFSKVWTHDARKWRLSYLCMQEYQDCPQACRGNEINKFLWELTHSDITHPEFI